MRTNSLLKKGLVIGIIEFFIGISVIPGINGIFLDQLDQQVPNWNGAARGVLPPNKLAQSFKPTMNALTRVEIIAQKYGPTSPGNLLISIRSSLNGTDLTSISISANSVPQSGGWVEFDFQDISVIPEQSYYIVFHADNSWNTSNNLLWGECADNPYSRGEQWKFNGNNGTWNLIPPNPYVFDFCFKTYGYSALNQPPNPPTITGPNQGKIKVETEYNFMTTDPENDTVYYFIDWGDNNNSGWIGPYQSAEQITKSHTWFEKGTYVIKAKAKDNHGNESDWGKFTVTMPMSYVQPHFRFFKWLFERSPHAFPILRHLMGY